MNEQRRTIEPNRRASGGSRSLAGRGRAVASLVAIALAASACGVPFADRDDATPRRQPVTTLSSVDADTAEARVTASATEAGSSERQNESDPAAPAVMADGGASDVVKRVEITVGPSMVDGGELAVALELETLAPTSWTLGVVTLLDDTGAAIATGRLHDDLGATLQPVQFSGRDHRNAIASFVVPNERELTSSTDLTEYAIEFAIDDEVPLVLPLDGPGFARRYPLPLAHGAESSAASGTFAGCSGDGIELDTIIDRATVGLEQSDDRASRVSPGRRIVSIDLALTNSNDDQVNCKELILWPTFDLVVDGATVPAFRYDTSPVEANATVVLELEFDIPAGANRLELTGGSDRTTLAAWDVELPLAAGELGQDGPRQPMIGVGPAPAGPTLSPSPDERLHVERSSGGAAGSVLGADFVVGTSVAANVAIETLASPSGGERDELGRTWLAVDVRIDATADSRWSLDPTAVVLEDPTGRPHAVIDRFEDGDRLNTPTRFDGPETFQQRFIFETDGIVDDVTGWTLVVEPADVIALRLPLVGDVAVEWPRSLSAGASRDFSVGSYGGCTSTDGDEINATVVDAALDIERRNPFDDLRRVLPGHRYLRVDLDLTNLVPAPAVFDSTTANCGAAILWPSYLVRADGRFLQAFSTVDRALIDYGTTERETVVFQIPADTQVVELYAGVDPTLIAGWQLKDSVEVLTDFGATEADEQTLVTLDERVLFAFGSAELTDDAIAPLTRLAAVLIEDSVGEVVITGHTDSIGDDESNDQLSLDRAAAVVDFLVEAGVDLNRLSAVGAGEAWPVAPNQHEDGSDDPIGRAMNRRVELLFTTAT